ncbi:MAG TPA: hypothetical protein VLH09_09580 [Bryobacteraceae bacterium]|nr:hypothetical protein [Bryobacteraceae bacterium]
MTDRINIVNHGVFNAEGQLFNADQPVADASRRFLRPIPPTPDPSIGTKVERPKRFTTLNAPSEAQKQTQPAEALVVPVVGCLAAVRAARIAQQHREQIWSADSVVGLVSENGAADPTPDQIDQMYEDLRLFSYLPESMIPTREEFDDLAKPQRRTTVVQTSLSSMGIVLRTAAATRPQLETQEDNNELLPDQVPFYESSLNNCG